MPQILISLPEAESRQLGRLQLLLRLRASYYCSGRLRLRLRNPGFNIAECAPFATEQTQLEADVIACSEMDAKGVSGGQTLTSPPPTMGVCK